MKLNQTIQTLLIFMFSSWTPITAQQSSFKEEFLKKWKNSREYTIKVAERMPAEKYQYKPTEDMRTFGEQIEHIGYALTFLPKKALNIKEVKYKGSLTDKETLIAYLKGQFEIIKTAVEKIDNSDFEKTTSFWAGRMTRRKILNVTFDHITHTRAQAIIYLRINDIKAPQYIAW
ncbi:DinB family protein [uncultured Aquimarina sp.]|uniref:DinB family protein n=1 Tax=uncultured Aquimarina sp. TaxID=575652 RepID=UPI0026368F90|nr:DinB family protein [uncultured Aquimarina sp.]